MSILHLLKSEPDGETRALIAALSEGRESEEVPLYGGNVDYGDLVKKVFENERVVCWW